MFNLPTVPQPDGSKLSMTVWNWLRQVYQWARGETEVATSQTVSFTAKDLFIYPCDATSGNITVTLPFANKSAAKKYWIKKTDSSGNTVTISPQTGDLIDGASSKVLSTQYADIILESDANSNWWVLAYSGSGAIGTPGGANTQLQYNNSGSFGGISTFTYDSGRVATSQNGGSYLLNQPAMVHGHQQGIMTNTANINFTGSTTSDFFCLNNTWFGDQSVSIPSGSKGNFSCYEANMNMSTSLADTNGIDGAHAFGATMTHNGTAPMQGVSMTITRNTNAAQTTGVVANLTMNVACTSYGFLAESYGSQNAKTAFKVLSKADDASATNWTNGADLGGNQMVGVTQIGFMTAAGVATDYNVNGKNTDILRIVGGGTSGGIIFYSRSSGANAAGQFRFRDNIPTGDVDGIVLDGINGYATIYNKNALVGVGMPSIVAKANLTGQTASIAATTLYTIPASGADGLYRINYTAEITTVGTVSSTIGPFQALYTSKVDSGARTTPALGSDSNTGNTLNTIINNTKILNCKSGTTIQYQMGYTSNAAATMTYDLAILLEYLGPAT